MTKTAFLEAYRAEIIKSYQWAQNEEKLNNFMSNVRQTICAVEIFRAPATWNNSGEALMAAWRAIGGKGKPTYKALRALPD
jgi:hypothetical protein